MLSVPGNVPLKGEVKKLVEVEVKKKGEGRKNVKNVEQVEDKEGEDEAQEWGQGLAMKMSN